MNSAYFSKILACPVCNIALRVKKHRQTCKLKKVLFKNTRGIWEFLPKETDSQIKNENLHQKGSWGRINDGSYEILASFARGNRTLDIACGEGWIEDLSPQTVGLDFSLSALKKAKKNGAKYLVRANAEALPFIDDAFDLTISAGSLENIEDPKKAVKEMARVSKIQIMTVHREFDIPLIRMLRRLLTLLFKIKHQPVEKPIKWKELEKMLNNANLKVVFKGYWTLPINHGNIIPFLPVFTNIPSCFFVITTKKELK